MSLCMCPVEGQGNPVGQIGFKAPELKAKQKAFMESLGWPAQPIAKAKWSLLELREIAERCPTKQALNELLETMPFRGGPCERHMRCCANCTRRCGHRCIQDCLNRLAMWRMAVENGNENIPLAVRLIVEQDFEDAEHMSWCVSEILSEANRRYPKGENPNKLNYEPAAEVDLQTGGARILPDSGIVVLLDWPASGLCPYCLPEKLIDGRVARKARIARAKEQNLPG